MYGTYQVSVYTTGYEQCVNRMNITLANPGNYINYLYFLYKLTIYIEQLTVHFADTDVSCHGAGDGAFTASVTGISTLFKQC